MSNIFLQLKGFKLNHQALRKLTENSNDDLISEFFQSDHTEPKQYCDLFINLIKSMKNKEAKDKVFIALVYYISQMETNQAKGVLNNVLQLKQDVITKVRFFSNVYKSVKNQDLRKWLLWTTVNLITTIENSDKISPYANFIEHFDQLIEGLALNDQESLEIYCKLIVYLEKHPVYKRLCSLYVIKGLQKVTDKSSELQMTTSLILKAVRYGNISDSALSLLNHKPLHKNKAYPIFQTLLTGDFQKLDMSHISQYQKQGLVGNKVLRKMKIEAIPRLIGTSIKRASYSQVAELLNIEKKQVQSYIIDAIKQGIIQAKLDEFEECIIINRINFRALRKQERAKLQKDISNLCEKLSN